MQTIIWSRMLRNNISYNAAEVRGCYNVRSLVELLPSSVSMSLSAGELNSLGHVQPHFRSHLAVDWLRVFCALQHWFYGVSMTALPLSNFIINLNF